MGCTTVRVSDAFMVAQDNLWAKGVRGEAAEASGLPANTQLYNSQREGEYMGLHLRWGPCNGTHSKRANVFSTASDFSSSDGGSARRGALPLPSDPVGAPSSSPQSQVRRGPPGRSKERSRVSSFQK